MFQEVVLVVEVYSSLPLTHSVLCSTHARHVCDCAGFLTSCFRGPHVPIAALPLVSLPFFVCIPAGILPLTLLTTVYLYPSLPFSLHLFLSLPLFFLHPFFSRLISSWRESRLHPEEVGPKRVLGSQSPLHGRHSPAICSRVQPDRHQGRPMYPFILSLYCACCVFA
jgi:hypothetical protein